jgi:RNA polymerase sigma-70 factor, ECF subfamily
MANAAGGDIDILSLEDALVRLDALAPRQARVVELRYFAGLDVEETAKTLGLSPATVKRDWTFARAYLLRELSDTNA